MELAWADHLVSIKEYASAVEHFIEAHAQDKAVDAYIKAKRYNDAAKLAEQLGDTKGIEKHLGLLAHHFAQERKYEEASRFFFRSNQRENAVKMYIDAGHFEKAISVARSFMPKEDVDEMKINHADSLRKSSKFSEASTFYVSAERIDLAIEMYRENQMFTELIDVVAEMQPDDLEETRLFGKEYLL